jgi:arylsulfatase A-like enzyme
MMYHAMVNCLDDNLANITQQLKAKGVHPSTLESACGHSLMIRLYDSMYYMPHALAGAGMWENTLMVLSSDNGGYVKDYDGGCNTSTGFEGLESTDSGHGAACFNGEAGANNFPLRAGKYERMHECDTYIGPSDFYLPAANVGYTGP